MTHPWHNDPVIRFCNDLVCGKLVKSDDDLIMCREVIFSYMEQQPGFNLGPISVPPENYLNQSHFPTAAESGYLLSYWICNNKSLL